MQGSSSGTTVFPRSPTFTSAATLTLAALRRLLRHAGRQRRSRLRRQPDRPRRVVPGGRGVDGDRNDRHDRHQHRTRGEDAAETHARAHVVRVLDELLEHPRCRPRRAAGARCLTQTRRGARPAPLLPAAANATSTRWPGCRRRRCPATAPAPRRPRSARWARGCPRPRRPRGRRAPRRHRRRSWPSSGHADGSHPAG